MGKENNNEREESKSKLRICERIIKADKQLNPKRTLRIDRSFQVSQQITDSKSKSGGEETEDQLSLKPQQVQEDKQINFLSDETAAITIITPLEEQITSIVKAQLIIQQESFNVLLKEQQLKNKKALEEINTGIEKIKMDNYWIRKQITDQGIKLNKLEKDLKSHLRSEQIQMLGDLYVKLRDKIFGKYVSYANFTESIKDKEPHIQEYLKEQLKNRIEASGLTEQEFKDLQDRYENTN